MLLGTTFSHRHLSYLRVSLDEALDDLLSLEFDLVRIGIYWDEVEPEPGKFNFSRIRQVLDFFENNNQGVVLTIGMKAPRWPEFYLPGWLNETVSMINTEEYVLSFVHRSIEELKGYSCIKYWQVENEPLDPSGPDKLTIPLEILQKEVELVRKLDTRPIIINIWGNTLTKRGLYSKIEEIADIIGIDLYYKTPWLARYHGPKDSDERIREVLTSTKKPYWITELQCEPWERNERVAFSDNPPSMNSDLAKSYFLRAAKINPDVILLWGFEYWVFKKKNGDQRLWNTVREISRAKT